jgi:hypothetical protein
MKYQGGAIDRLDIEFIAIKWSLLSLIYEKRSGQG